MEYINRKHTVTVRMFQLIYLLEIPWTVILEYICVNFSLHVLLYRQNQNLECESLVT